MALPFLQTIGLTQKEAELYELLLRVGEAPAQEIIRESKLKRATVYKSLYSLEKKGLVTHKDISKKIHFRPESPTKLLSFAEKQYTVLEEAKESLQSFLPHLSSQYVLSVEKPVVSTFEGREGLQKIYEDILTVGKDIYAVLHTEELDEKMYGWLTKSFVPRRVKLDIHAHVIVASGEMAKDYRRRDKTSLRTSILVPYSKFPFQHEADIYGDKVAFINFRKDSHMIGVIIHHPLIAKTMKAWFDLSWQGAQLQK